MRPPPPPPEGCFVFGFILLFAIMMISPLALIYGLVLAALKLIAWFGQ
jgi:hypothetical protein